MTDTITEICQLKDKLRALEDRQFWDMKRRITELEDENEQLKVEWGKLVNSNGDLILTRDRLEAENAALVKQVEYWQGQLAQFWLTTTEGFTF